MFLVIYTGTMSDLYWCTWGGGWEGPEVCPRWTRNAFPGVPKKTRFNSSTALDWSYFPTTLFNSRVVTVNKKSPCDSTTIKATAVYGLGGNYLP